jgi:hypothetical protein
MKQGNPRGPPNHIEQELAGQRSESPSDDVAASADEVVE